MGVCTLISAVWCDGSGHDHRLASAFVPLVAIRLVQSRGIPVALEGKDGLGERLHRERSQQVLGF